MQAADDQIVANGRSSANAQKPAFQTGDIVLVGHHAATLLGPQRAKGVWNVQYFQWTNPGNAKESDFRALHVADELVPLKKSSKAEGQKNAFEQAKQLLAARPGGWGSEAGRGRKLNGFIRRNPVHGGGLPDGDDEEDANDEEHGDQEVAGGAVAAIGAVIEPPHEAAVIEAPHGAVFEAPHGAAVLEPPHGGIAQAPLTGACRGRKRAGGAVVAIGEKRGRREEADDAPTGSGLVGVIKKMGTAVMGWWSSK